LPGDRSAGRDIFAGQTLQDTAWRAWMLAGNQVERASSLAGLAGRSLARWQLRGAGRRAPMQPQGQEYAALADPMARMHTCSWLQEGHVLSDMDSQESSFSLVGK